jgi:hypothetical protein
MKEEWNCLVAFLQKKIVGSDFLVLASDIAPPPFFQKIRNIQ